MYRIGSSIYTRIYAKAGDSTDSLVIDDSYTWVTESGVSIAGQYGTLVIYNNGAYTYTPSTTALPAGFKHVICFSTVEHQRTAVAAVNLHAQMNGDRSGNHFPVSAFQCVGEHIFRTF